MKWLMLAFVLAGCSRALPLDEPTADAAPMVAVDAGARADLAPARDLVQADMLCWDDDSSALCYPIRHDLAIVPNDAGKLTDMPCYDLAVCYPIQHPCVDAAKAACITPVGVGCELGFCRI